MKNILLLIDEPRNAEPNAHFALQFAIKTNANLILGHAYQKKSKQGSNQTKDDERLARLQDEMMELTDSLRKSLPTVKEEANNSSVRCIVEEAELAEFTLKMVAEQAIDLIVISPQKEISMAQLLFGSILDLIFDKASCPVLIVPPHAIFKGFAHITFAADFSFNYQNALRYIAVLALAFKAKLTVNNVSNLGFPAKIAEIDISKAVNEILGAGFPPVAYHTLKGSDVSTTLNNMLEENEVDLLCLVHRKYDFLQGLFHSSISKKMTRTVTIPLLILPYLNRLADIQMNEMELERFCFSTDEDR